MRQTTIPRGARIVILLLSVCALGATGAAWWDGLDVDPEVYSEDLVHDGEVLEFKREGSFEKQIGRLHRDLQDVPVKDLLSRCEAVIAAGLAAEKERDQSGDDSARRGPQSRYGGPRVRAWLLCMVAVRRMGESGEQQRWVPVLERLHDKWEEVSGGGNQMVGSAGVAVAGRPLWWVLSRKTKDAYRKLALRDVGLAELATAFRQAVAEDFESLSRLQVRARYYQRIELSREGPWPPEYRSLWEDPDPDIRKRILRATPLWFIAPEEHPVYLSLLEDPEPGIQEYVWGVLTATAYLSVPIIPSLLEFLEREDLDERTRRMARDGINARGYAVKQTAEGIVLEADENEKIRAHLEWLTDSDSRWRGTASVRLRDWTRLRPEGSFPLVLDFLAREDIDDNAQEIATGLLSQRGYAPATGPGGCLIAVPEDGGPPILQKDCRPQDEP